MKKRYSMMLTSVLLAISFGSTSMAQERVGGTFEKYVQVIKGSNGEVDELQTVNRMPFSVKEYLEFLRIVLAKAQQNPEIFSREINTWGRYEDGEGTRVDLKLIGRQALVKIGKTDFEKEFNDPKFIKLMADFENELGKSLLNPFVIAKPSDPAFFFRRRFLDKLLDQFIGLAWSALDSVPGAALAQFIFKRVVDHIEDRQKYYQNFVLHYLETYPAAEFKLTEADSAKIRSSIYESRISWWKIWKSKEAQKTWMTYGNKEFAEDIEKGQQRLAKNSDQYDSVLTENNFGFATVQKGPSTLVYNTQTKAGLLDNRLSLGYSYVHPKQLFVERIVFEVIHIGLRFVPAPGIVKQLADDLIESRYKGQIDDEGALFAHFYDGGKSTEATITVRQSINPFIIRDNLGEGYFSRMALDL